MDTRTRVRAAAERDAHTAVSALRGLVERLPHDITPLDGLDDETMDAWPVPVPEAVRIVLREFGGFDSAEHGVFAFAPRPLTGASGLFRNGCHEVWSSSWYSSSVLVGVGDRAGAAVVGADGAGPDGVGADGVGADEGEGPAERPDWGPVVSVEPFEEHRATVEAPTFTHWLADLAERIADDGWDDSAPPPAAARVPALPSVRVAAGADRELAALAGPADALTDVADLRSLPAYPCAVDWEPYYSTAHGTADTGSSEMLFELAGGGAVLRITSVARGDFLGRPVERPVSPPDAAVRAVAELRALERELPELVRLDAGLSDAELDAWPVPVPEDVRMVLREFGGVRIADRTVLDVRPGAGRAPGERALELLGGGGSLWPVAEVPYGSAGSLAHVRVDPDSGAWGAVVATTADPERLARDPELTLLAESLPHLLLTAAATARAAADAARTPGGELRAGDFPRGLHRSAPWFPPGTDTPWALPQQPGPTSELSGEPLPAEVAALPAGSVVCDLRGVPIPAEAPFHRSRHWSHHARTGRLHFFDGGRIVAVAPAADGD